MQLIFLIFLQIQIMENRPIKDLTVPNLKRKGIFFFFKLLNFGENKVNFGWFYVIIYILYIFLQILGVFLNESSEALEGAQILKDPSHPGTARIR